MKDYMMLLTGKLKSKAAAIFGNTTPYEVPKVPKGGSVTFGTASGVVSGKNQGDGAEGFGTFDTKAPHGNSRPFGRGNASVLERLKNKIPSPRAVPKVPKGSRRTLWRPVPYWPACIEATREGGILAAQQLYTALALKYGHSPEEIDGYLTALVPHIHRRHVDPLIKSQWADAYVAAHPYAWELKLIARDYYEAAEAA